MLHVRLVCVVLATVFGLAGIAAGVEYDLRPWMGAPGVGGIGNEEVFATTTWDPDGDGPQPEALVVGGKFPIAGDAVAQNIAAYDGASWQPLGSGLGGGVTTTSVRALAVYQGELIAAGDFSTSGDTSCNAIARWDGQQWHPLGTGIAGQVRAMTVYNGELIAGGYFTTAGGVSCRSVARWNGQRWAAVGYGCDGEVRALAAYNGRLYAGGDFRSPAYYLAEWDGTQWRSVGGYVAGFMPYVNAMRVSNNELVVTGDMDSVGGVECNGIARWDGTTWRPLGAGIGGGYALAEYEGRLIATGWFLNVGGVLCNYIASWDGSIWKPLGTGLGDPPRPNGPVHVNAATAYQGQLFVGGNFLRAGDAACKSLARWDGTQWHRVASGMNGMVQALGEYEGDLVVAGSFTCAGDQNCRGIARWDGSAWQPFGTGIDVATSWGSVGAVTTYGEDLVAAGYFASAGGVPCSNIARWDGNTWQPLGAGVNSSVGDVIVYNGELIVGGGFTMAGDVPCNGIARWNGATWQPLGDGVCNSGGPGTVGSLMICNGDLIVAGTFLTAGGVTCNSIARWDGTTWHSLGGGMTAADPTKLPSVGSLVVFKGELIAEGGFVSAGGTACAGFARWDGQVWRPLGGELQGWARGLLATDDDLIAYGAIISAGGVPCNYIACWDGSAWRPFAGGVNHAYIPAMAIWRGELVAGGNFWTAGETAAVYLARWGLKGDIDRDGTVNVFDIFLLAEAWNTAEGDEQYDPACDVDHDGAVNVFDIFVLAENWNASVSS